MLADEEAARAEVLAKARAALDLLQPGAGLEQDEILVDGQPRGPGYGIPTDAMRAAVRLMARSEGMLLDPVYSGKAFGGLLRDVAGGLYPEGATVLFVMTGGVPGLFAYPDAFSDAG